MTPGIFAALERTGTGARRRTATYRRNEAVAEDGKIYGYTFEGKRHDTGDKLGFLKATVEFALKRPDLGGEMRAWLKDLKL